MRAYDKARDLEALLQVWDDIGWIEDEDDRKLAEEWFDVGHAFVAEEHGRLESFAHVTSGTMRLQDVDLPLAAVTGVGTGHVARRRGHGGRLVAAGLAQAVEAGAVVAGLGIFDQGYYDRLGFGNGPYMHRFRFDPASLQVPAPTRAPVRLTKDDWAEAHACWTAARRVHGTVVLDAPVLLKAELGWTPSPFGLGFRDDAGTLTHFLFGAGKGEHGPYDIGWLAYRDVDGLLELLGALRTLADQVHEVTVVEPPELQLQDLLRTPFRDARKSGRKGYQQAASWHQVRVLDVPACVAALRAREEVAFALDLHDPVTEHLPDGTAWPGSGGRYVVHLGEASRAEPATSSDLPVLTAGVAAFSRLLFGVRPASVLANTTDLDGPRDLLAALDRAIDLPPFHVGWDY